MNCGTSDSQPFLVYAADAPIYHDIYGDCGGSSAPAISGSIVAVSGGKYRTEASSCSCECKINLTGVLDQAPLDCARSAEQCIQALIEPDEHVTILYNASRIQTRDWLATVKQSGVQVVETDDVTPGFDNAYAVCNLSGAELPQFHWLDQVIGYDPFFLFAWKGQQNQFADQITSSALRGRDPAGVIRAFQDKSDYDSGAAFAELGDYSLFAFQVGPDANTLVVNRRSPDTSCLKSIFGSAAASESIALYDAGTLHRRDFRGRGIGLADFEGWLEWQTLPHWWQRVN